MSDALGKIVAERGVRAKAWRSSGPEPYYLPSEPFAAFVQGRRSGLDRARPDCRDRAEMSRAGGITQRPVIARASHTPSSEGRNSKRGWDREAKRQQNSHHPRRQPAAADSAWRPCCTPRTSAASTTAPRSSARSKTSVSDIVRQAARDRHRHRQRRRAFQVQFHQPTAACGSAALSPIPIRCAMMGRSRDSLAFPATYAEMAAMNAARSPEVAARRTMPTASTISKAPVTYVGQAEVAQRHRQSQGRA